MRIWGFMMVVPLALGCSSSNAADEAADRDSTHEVLEGKTGCEICSAVGDVVPEAAPQDFCRGNGDLWFGVQYFEGLSWMWSPLCGRCPYGDQFLVVDDRCRFWMGQSRADEGVTAGGRVRSGVLTEAKAASLYEKLAVGAWGDLFGFDFVDMALDSGGYHFFTSDSHWVVRSLVQRPALLAQVIAETQDTFTALLDRGEPVQGPIDIGVKNCSPQQTGAIAEGPIVEPPAGFALGDYDPEGKEPDCKTFDGRGAKAFRELRDAPCDLSLGSDACEAAYLLVESPSEGPFCIRAQDVVPLADGDGCLNGKLWETLPQVACDSCP